MSSLSDIVNNSAVVVLSKTTCPYCTRVKGVLGQYDLKDIKYVELNTLANGSDLQNQAQALTGQRTVPNVFVGGKSIGGCDDTTKLHDSGDLKKMFEDAGAL